MLYGARTMACALPQSIPRSQSSSTLLCSSSSEWWFLSSCPR